MNTRTKLWAAVGAGAVILAACGSDSDDDSATTEVPAQEPADDPEPEPAAEPEPEPAAEPEPEPAAEPEPEPAGAESVTFTVEIANVSGGFEARIAEGFAVPVGEAEPGPALPGSAYEWGFSAASGERLSFATMFVQSNDWFFAPGADGLALFDDDGNPITGDVTDQITIWDAGTEVDQELGTGPDQAPRQAGPDAGDVDPDPTVRMIEDRVAADYVTVSLAHDGESFTLLIENTSEGADVSTPLAPGVGVVHSGGQPIFTPGEPDRGLGLEGLAEDGGGAVLAEAITATSGVATPLAPGVVIATDEGQALFTGGEADRGEGLEALAEDGDPAALAEATGAVAFAVPDGATDPGPLLPGSSYIAEFEAAPGQVLDLATMFVQSNDWFFAADGIALFDADGAPVTGDITDQITLWDSGTEIDQVPGVGADQAPRQAGPDTGDVDPDPTVRLVGGFDVGDYVTVTLTAAS